MAVAARREGADDALPHQRCAPGDHVIGAVDGPNRPIGAGSARSGRTQQDRPQLAWKDNPEEAPG